MAKQIGIIKLKGKIGDLSFYKTKDGHLAREKVVLMRNELRTILRLSVRAKMELSSEVLRNPVNWCATLSER